MQIIKQNKIKLIHKVVIDPNMEAYLKFESCFYALT